MANFEKLGAFYLGRSYDLQAGRLNDDLLLYDSKDLTTHAVCLGMTGSGKTGLCVPLLEEAAIDGIPAIVIDPKGDLGNLLLTFPALEGEDFLPWVDEEAAGREGRTPAAHAAAEADRWQKGLASWDQDGDRIRRLKAAAEFAIYTPGSDAGRPVSILASFAAPPAPVRADGDLMRDRVAGTATSLLGLVGIDADPVRSREHILLSNLLLYFWDRAEDLDLGGLIQAIQAPPVTRVGVMDLETFYPAADRFELALRLNSLLAAPGFQGWLNGDPLDVQRLLYTDSGKPRVAIFSIAHLAEPERMFFVSLLLNEVLGWTRTRPGTTSLRALLYMDEIYGFIPPTAEPPSKKPLLTLLKQGRAYGLGVVLATQNPVDLDYKGLSNAGTWFLGRLQTERDKLRVLEGLEGAAVGSHGGFDRRAMERTLGGLGKRVFLMHDVHEDAPVVFHVRWARSYLRGPLTREQIRRLTPETVAETPGQTPPSPGAGEGVSAPAVTPPSSDRPTGSPRPVLPPTVPEAFLPSRANGDALTYTPGLLGLARIQYVDRSSKRLRHSEDIALLAALPENDHQVDWAAAADVDVVVEELEDAPVEGATFGDLIPAAERARSYAGWRKRLADSLYRGRACRLLKSPSLGLVSEPGESERDFRARLGDLAHEHRDRLTDRLRKKYARRLGRLEERIRKAEQSVEREQAQASGQKLQTAIAVGATVLSALLGRKRVSLGTLGRVTTAARGVGRSAKERRDVARAEENVEALQAQLAELNAELEAEIDVLEESIAPATEALETVALRPRRADIEIRLVALAWQPK